MKRLLILTLTACTASANHTDQKTKGLPKASTLETQAAAGVESPQLQALLVKHWTKTLEFSPRFATMLGEHRFDHLIGDDSKAGIEKKRAFRRSLLEEAKAIDRAPLNKIDRITLDLFIENLQSDVESEVCKFELWSLSPRGNPLSDWNYLAVLHQVKTVEDGQNLIARYKQAPKAIDDHIANLARGAKAGFFANRETTGRVLKMFGDQLKKPTAEWPMLKSKEKPGWKKEQLEAFQQELSEVIEKSLRPALMRYRDFVEKTVLPSARAEGGLVHLPFGKACYEARIKHFTTLPLTAEALHETGQKEIARINGEMKILGQKLFGTDDLKQIIERLHKDETLYFSSAEEIEKKAARALGAARSKMVDYFGILPKADCVIQRVPDYEAPFTTIAYYRPPVPDGSKPGEYFVNVHAPKTRPKFEAEALAFHESIPGHHLQIAISQELPALPSFRKHLGMTAYVEGWALYTEQLADEMGLYSGDLDRMGMLSYEAWRAARLVVDTGIHAMGWSREKAKDYMAKHTALAANNIDNEVDRYIVWPGQALGYKVGQLEIWKLRRAAEAKMGARFDIKAFHDQVLSLGAVSLPVLKSEIEAWSKIP